MEWVFYNGQFLRSDRPIFLAHDRGILCGDGLYETIRATQGVPIWFDEHFARLRSGARAMKLPIPLSGAKIHAAFLELLKRNRISEARLRIVLTRGVPKRTGDHGLPPRLGSPHNPSLLLTAVPSEFIDSMNWARLQLSPWRLNSQSPLAGLKTCNTLFQVFCREGANAQGFEDALFLTHRGHIAETSRANFFFLREGKLFTPSLDTGILAGTTRDWVLSAAPKLGMRVIEGRFPVGRLKAAEACMVTSSIMGLRAVSQIGKLRFPRRVPAELRNLFDAYQQAVADQVEAFFFKSVDSSRGKRRGPMA